MKTYYTTSFGQPEGYRGGFAVPTPLCLVCGSQSGPAVEPACSCGRPAVTGYRAPAVVASTQGSELDYNPFVCCLLLFSLLLAARLLPDLPPAEASSLLPAVVEGYQAAAPRLRQVVAAPLASAELPSFVVAHARAGPARPPVPGAAHWLRGNAGYTPP